MKKVKIVFIGAGSMSFGLSVFKDVFSSPELAGSEFNLVDIDKTNLDRMYGLALKLKEASGLDLNINAYTDRKEALPNADFVINSIAIERTELWKQDFEVPKKYGIRHCLGENGGPGALFFTLRTIPDIIDIARDMEKLCPDAYFINFSNPESRVILALGQYTKIKSVGLCHGVFMGIHSIANITGVKYENIDVLAAGMNHCQWFLKITEKSTGKDLYPEVLEKEQSCAADYLPFSRKLMKIYGYFPSPSDDHVGEYFSYGYEAGEHGYDFDVDAKYRTVLAKEIEEVIAGKRDVADYLKPSGEKALEFVKAVASNKKTYIPSAIINNNGVITNLPDDCAVEVPIVVDGTGITPMHIGKLPASIQGILLPQATVQQLSVKAAVEASKTKALQTLLAAPVINSSTAAEKILDDL